MKLTGCMIWLFFVAIFMTKEERSMVENLK